MILFLRVGQFPKQIPVQEKVKKKQAMQKEHLEHIHVYKYFLKDLRLTYTTYKV